MRFRIALDVAAITALALLSASCGDRHPRVDIKPGVFSGVRLTTQLPTLVRRACGQAQREVVIRVVCPPLVPKVPLVRTVGLWGAIDFDRHLWMITFNNGNYGPGYLHWIAGAGRRSSVRHFLFTDAVNEVKGMPRQVATERAYRWMLLTYRYPDYPAGGPNGGHIAVFVSCGGEYVFASVHGGEHRAAARAMALALAEKADCPSS